MQKQKQLIYRIENKWYIFEFGKLFCMTLLICYLWFNSLVGIVFAVCFGIFCFRQDRLRYLDRQCYKTRIEFKDFLVLLSGNLSAGYALEGAFSQTYKDMQKQYGASFIIQSGIERCVNGVRMNQKVEYLFEEFADSVGIAEIADCARLLSLSKQYGGNMIVMIKRVADNVAGMLAVEQEIETMEAQKKLEGRIMLGAPFGIVAYLRMTNPGYFDLMYNTIYGQLIMGITLLIIAVVGIWMNKILTIQ